MRPSIGEKLILKQEMEAGMTQLGMGSDFRSVVWAWVRAFLVWAWLRIVSGSRRRMEVQRLSMGRRLESKFG